MRHHFLQTCYNALDLTRTSTPDKSGRRRMLFTPKAMLFGIRLMLHWGDLDESDLHDICIDGMRDNTKVGIVNIVRNDKVLSYLRACKINTSNLYMSGRANTYRWFEGSKDVGIVSMALRVAPTLIRTALITTFYKEYEHVQQEHNRFHYVPFAHTYSQKAPEAAGAEGGHQGDGGGVCPPAG